MELPPRVKTQYPNKESIVNDTSIPVPIETVFFLEDADQDNTRYNRYYFNFPAEWSTSNRGESIIGVRNIKMVARKRKIEFDLSIRKYLRDSFNILKEKEENKDKTDDEIYDMLGEKEKGEITCHIISWLDPEEDLRKLFYDVRNQLKQVFNDYNEKVDAKYQTTTKNWNELIKTYRGYFVGYINPFNRYSDMISLIFNSKEIFDKFKEKITDFLKKNKDLLIPRFVLDDVNRSTNDIQMDGYYDYAKNTFIETIFSPINIQIQKYVKDENATPTPISSPTPAPPYVVIDESEAKVIGSLYYIDFKVNFNQKITEKSYNKYDFVDVFNIGTDPFQNDPKKYQNKWLRRLDFENIWDRQECIIYSSIAEQSNRHYIGESNIMFEPIKYYKLNSSDQRFWIEFYSGTHHKIPIKIPNNESFKIEMQFLPYNKMLYV